MTAPAWARDMATSELRKRQGPRGTASEYDPPSADEQMRDLIDEHDVSSQAHQLIRQMVIDALNVVGATPNDSGGWNYAAPGLPDATLDRKGVSRILGGTAEYPQVPWGSVSSKPFIPKTFAELTGTVPQSALPPVALTDYLGAVNSQANMLALTGQRGDWCTRTDQSMDYQLIADTPTALASWRAMTYPAAPVSSVNGRTGAVTGLAEQTTVAQNTSAINTHTGRTDNPHNLTKSQIGLGSVDNTADVDKPLSTSSTQALAGKADAMPDDIDVQATAATTVNSSAAAGTDLNGATTTVTSPGTNARYYVSAVFDVAAGANNSTSGIFVGRLLVDGVVQPRAGVAVLTVNGQRATISQQWVITGLSAGNHTLKLNGLVTSTSTYILAATHTSLIISRQK